MHCVWYMILKDAKLLFDFISITNAASFMLRTSIECTLPSYKIANNLCEFTSLQQYFNSNQNFRQSKWNFVSFDGMRLQSLKAIGPTYA